jgi:rhodanese-related sulfurtransferase
MDIQVTAEQLQDWLRTRSVLLIDVRALSEFHDAHLPGAIHIPLDSIGPQLRDQIPGADTTVVTICAHGFRSRTAAERLRALGLKQVYSLAGGMQAFAQTPSTASACSIQSSGFDRPRSIIYGAIHCVGAALALLQDPQWAYLNLFLGAGMVLNGLIGWCGLSLIFRR